MSAFLQRFLTQKRLITAVGSIMGFDPSKYRQKTARPRGQPTTGSNRKVFQSDDTSSSPSYSQQSDVELCTSDPRNRFGEEPLVSDTCSEETAPEHRVATLENVLPIILGVAEPKPTTTKGFLVTIGIGLLGAWLFGSVYSWVTHDSAFVLLNIFLALVLGVLVGCCVGYAALTGKVENSRLVCLAGLAIGCAALVWSLHLSGGFAVDSPGVDGGRLDNVVYFGSSIVSTGGPDSPGYQATLGIVLVCEAVLVVGFSGLIARSIVRK